MHWLDFVLLLVLAIGAFLGARSGLLWQVARVLTFFLAIYFCIHHHTTVAGWLLQTMRGASPTVTRLLAYLVTFLSVYAACMVMTYVLEKALRAAKLKPIDRVFGALIGVVKAGLLAGAILLGVALYATPGEADNALGESKVAPVLLKTMQVVIVAVPQQYKDRLGETLERLKHVASEKIDAPGDSNE
jgi:membrane protein required for colicin V production